MLTEERHQLIMDILESQNVAKVLDLVTATNSSETTIRRDLQLLEEEGYLKRVHGGAKIIREVTPELSLTIKENIHMEEKKQIAKWVGELIKDNEVIFIDSGTATYQVLPYLKDKKIRAVTNSVIHAQYLSSIDIPTIVLGGQLKMNTGAIVGNETLKQLEKYHFSKALVGVNAIHHQYGLTTPEEEEALVKQAIIEHAEETFILADHSKFETINFVKFGELTDGKIITDYLPAKFHSLYKEEIQIVEVTPK
ncbi:DeoR/GlpR family DNA-binding transcription regulator [Vagococcus zengguangii]|uniref:DeoR/GlpR family DNA-binding transcription regulator n=1 Tax=Vagococcus zengguangii TaxID=2571750 RepID=UPI00143D6ED5|nr:DeoR/GlpR family DNA-binding transcription regulator [Vagococcus zengguangii]